MICGALQTLNEEACEDVLEETEELINEIPQTSVIPPSPDSAQGEPLVSLDSLYPSNSMYKSCLSMKHDSFHEKSAKRVAYADEENAYIEPTITILEPQSITSNSVISVSRTMSSPSVQLKFINNQGTNV